MGNRLRKVTSSKEIPPKSIILEGFGHYDYADSFVADRSTGLEVDMIAWELFRMSGIGAFLLKVRDGIVGMFGLAAAGQGSPELDYYPVGSQLAIFTVLARNGNEIVMGEDDKHLIFRTSVLIDREESKIYLTTVVKYHNFWGRLYFLPVKPVHKILIRSQFKSKMTMLDKS